MTHGQSAARGFEPAAYVRVTDPAGRVISRALVTTGESARASAAVVDIRATAPARLRGRFVGPAPARFIPTEGTGHLHMAHPLEGANRRQAECGHTYLDAEAGACRPTLKGALLMSRKLARPVRQAREAPARMAGAVTLRSPGA